MEQHKIHMQRLYTKQLKISGQNYLGQLPGTIGTLHVHTKTLTWCSGDCFMVAMSRPFLAWSMTLRTIPCNLCSHSSCFLAMPTSTTKVWWRWSRELTLNMVGLVSQNFWSTCSSLVCIEIHRYVGYQTGNPVEIDIIDNTGRETSFGPHGARRRKRGGGGGRGATRPPPPSFKLGGHCPPQLYPLFT